MPILSDTCIQAERAGSAHARPVGRPFFGISLGDSGEAIAGATAATTATTATTARRRTAMLADPADEDAFWREAYVREPYYVDGLRYADYAPAFRLGYGSRHRYPGSFERAEEALRDEWERVKGTSRLSWEQANQAARSAWYRLDRVL